MSRIRHHLIRAHVAAHTALLAVESAAQRRNAAGRNERGSYTTELVVAAVVLLGIATAVGVAFRGFIAAKLAEFKP